MAEQRRHAPRDRQPAVAELLAVLPVEGEDALPLVARLDLAELARRHIGRIDDVDAAIVGEEEGGVAAMRGAAEGAAVAATNGGRPAAVPQRNPADPGAGGDEQRFLELVEWQRRMARAIAERSFGDLEAETEAARAPAVERREQRIVPHALQQLDLGGLAHHVNFRVALAGQPSVQLAPPSGPICKITADHFFRRSDAVTRLGGALRLAARPR